jgi:hypothetical protein
MFFCDYYFAFVGFDAHAWKQGCKCQRCKRGFTNNKEKMLDVPLERKTGPRVGVKWGKASFCIESIYLNTSGNA